ncbi:hypothetical protein FRC09_014150 [Ceratobasidium sp. 395]|nr:hypothetical protein FRC09_014150 [Ceratobasidium sp. 395]
MHALAFPGLYRTVYLCLASHIQAVSDRIISENDSTHLQIGAHLQNLVFDDRYDMNDKNGRECSEALGRFRSAIPKLKRLISMSWDSDWLPDNPANMFETFQLSCPELRSVSLYVSSPWFNFYSDECLKPFTDPSVDLDSVLPKVMIDMIRASPDLRSLELNLRDVVFRGLAWTPDQLCSGLNVTFPNLRVLRTLGAATPDWESFFNTPEASSYHQFLRRHPELHTVSMGWVQGHSWRDFSPEFVAALFPSLRHFEGPLFICQALTSSSVATQIESLSVLDESLEGGEISEFSESAVDIPNLQSLSLRSREPLNGDALSKLLSLTPRLRKLAVWSVTLDLSELINTLKYAPNLEELRIPIGQTLDVAQAMGTSSEPKLQKLWAISQTGGFGVHVTHAQLVLETRLETPSYYY